MGVPLPFFPLQDSHPPQRSWENDTSPCGRDHQGEGVDERTRARTYIEYTCAQFILQRKPFLIVKGQK